MVEDSTTGEAGDAEVIFAILNEVGIIAQLSRALLETQNTQGLTLPQFAVLNHLERLGLIQSPIQIAQAFQQPKTTMTHTLGTLEKSGLIATHPNPEDGRSKLVQITSAGRASRGKVIEDMAGDLMKLARDIGIERVSDALPMLTDMRKLLDSYRDNRPTA